MNLVFTETDGLWVAKFTATAPFNLHVERKKAGSLKVDQKTAGSEYAFSEDLSTQKVHDLDITGVIFPKEIRITSTSEVDLAIITF